MMVDWLQNDHQQLDTLRGVGIKAGDRLDYCEDETSDCCLVVASPSES
jgi:hypothetical protein